ncbi:MAG: hypothetical protein IKJ35_07855 [Clostridia bacterium]|nr:hypothetical protein [Clostridia bacterium]
MHTREIRCPSLPLAKEEASEILAQNGNRLLLIEAILLVMMNLPLYVMLDTATSLIIAWIDFSVGSTVLPYVTLTLHFVLVSLLALFLTLPSIIGLLDFARLIARGEAPVLADLFAPFTSPKAYFHALALGASAFWRIALIVLGTAAMKLLFQPAVDFGFPVYLRDLLLFFGVIGALLLWARRFPVLAVALTERISPQRAKERLREMPEQIDSSAGYGFFMGFLPKILLGLVTFGVLLLWDVLPQMLLAYFRYLGQTNEMIIQSEE